MPPKKNQQTEKLRLHQPDSAPTWQDKISGPPKKSENPPPQSPQKPEKIYKTYWLDPDVVKKVKSLAEEHQVGINELVEFLLLQAMGSVERNELEIPVKSQRNRIAQ